MVFLELFFGTAIRHEILSENYAHSTIKCRRQLNLKKYMKYQEDMSLVGMGLRKANKKVNALGRALSQADRQPASPRTLTVGTVLGTFAFAQSADEQPRAS